MGNVWQTIASMFPASAGMNRTRGQGYENDSHVPRKRGDEPANPLLDLTVIACSPQARG